MRIYEKVAIMSHPSWKTVESVSSDCISCALLHDVLIQLFQHIFDPVPQLDDIYKVAHAYDHWSFTSTIDKYTEAHAVLNACVSLARSVLICTDIYKEKSHHFNTIENATDMKYTEKNGRTHIILDKNKKISSANNTHLYLAWWNLTKNSKKITETIIFKINEANTQDKLTGETSYTLLTELLSNTSITEFAKTFQCDLKAIMTL